MTTNVPVTETSAADVLATLPTPVLAHDADGSVVYANGAFREATDADPVGAAAGAVLNGYEPGTGGGFVTPEGSDRRFVALVRTPARVECGDPCARTVLTLRAATPDDGATARPLETVRTEAPSDPVYAAARADRCEVSADEVLRSLATPVLAHDAEGLVTYANRALREATAVDPVGSAVGAVLDGYEPGAGGGFVTPVDSDRTFLAAVRTPPRPRAGTATGRDGGESGPAAVLTLLTATPGDGASVPAALERTTSGEDRAAGPFERIVENSNDSVFVMSTAQDEFSYVNERACEMLGYDRAELLSLTPRDVHPHDYPVFHEFMDRVVEEGSDRTTEVSCYHSDGGVVPAEVSAAVVEMDGRERLVASVRDVSTRVRQRTELRRLSRAMEATTEGVAVFGRDGVATYANPAFADALGPGDGVRGHTWAELFEDGDRFEMAVRPAAERRDGWTGTVEVTVDGARQVCALSVTAFEEYLLCVSRDVTARHRRLERLRGLTAASRAFADSEDIESVAGTAVSVVEDTLGFPAACFRVYDPEGNALDRVAETPRGAELLADRVAYDMDASRAGRAFRTGERVLAAAGEDAYAADRGHLHVPVGEAGVLTVAAADGFREGDAELLELFAETVRTVLARVEKLEQVREREAELDRHREELAAVVAFDDLVTDVIRSVVASTTRRETERAVCDRLVDAGQYVGAWILDTDRTVRAQRVAPEAPSPAGEAFVDSPFADRLLDGAADGLTVERRRFDAGEESETTTAVAVPVTYADRTFGTVVLATRDEHAFPAAARTGVELLAETLGFAVVASRSQAALLSSDVTEVVIEFPSAFSELTATHDCRCVFRAASATPDGELAYVGAVEGVDAGTVRSVIGDAPDVTSVTPEGPEECTVRTVGDGRVPKVVTGAGANVRSLVAEDGHTRMTAEVPDGVDVSALLDRLRDRFDGVSLHAKRDSRRLAPDRVLDGDALTERQREAVCTAYGAGYYEWPREHTAEEVATTLDVAASTFHRHLRTAQEKLVGELCGGATDPE